LQISVGTIGNATYPEPDATDLPISSVRFSRVLAISILDVTSDYLKMILKESPGLSTDVALDGSSCCVEYWI